MRLLALLLVIPALALAERPNVVLIVADDMGWGDLKPLYAGAKATLPTLEGLASDGLLFRDAHTTTSKCAPTRYSIATGNYQWRGLRSWGVWPYKDGAQVLAGQETLGALLQRAGYETAIVGKYHLGAKFRRHDGTVATSGDPDSVVDFSRPMEDGPGTRGYGYSYIAMRGIQASPYAFFEQARLVGASMVNWAEGDYGSTEILQEGYGVPDWDTSDFGRRVLDKSLAFMRQAERPFFLHLNTPGAHTPYKPPAAIGDRSIAGASTTARLDMLVEVDAIVDYLLRELDALGIADDTLVVFTSDNGAASADVWREGKGSIYEGGHRVPLVMRWGDRLSGVTDEFVGVHDLYATLAELTGVGADETQGRDSLSFLPVLSGGQSARTSMVFEADRPSRLFGYRDGDWSMVFNAQRQPSALYNLSSDPGQTTDLRAQYPARVSAMDAALDAALASQRTTPAVGVAASVTVHASGAGTDPSALIDGDLGTFWRNDGDASNAWFTLDLGASRHVPGLRIARIAEQSVLLTVTIGDTVAGGKAVGSSGTCRIFPTPEMQDCGVSGSGRYVTAQGPWPWLKVNEVVIQ